MTKLTDTELMHNTRSRIVSDMLREQCYHLEESKQAGGMADNNFMKKNNQMPLPRLGENNYKTVLGATWLRSCFTEKVFDICKKFGKAARKY